jgi:hypothetical protein
MLEAEALVAPVLSAEDQKRYKKEGDALLGVWQRFLTNWAIVCCRSTWKGVQYELNNHVDKLRDR